MKNASVITAWTFLVLFLVLALLGFISDSLPIDSAFLETNTILNLTHLMTAVGFAVVAKESVDESIHHIQVFGVAYMLISGIGFMGMNIQIGEPWSYALYLNFLNYVQFGLGVILCISGSMLKKHRRLIVA